MNLRQSYEQLIAHKLRKLPAPDADASWQQMKRLLDEDEDTRAGGKRGPGNTGGGWWRIGIIVIVLSASGWLYVKNTTTPGNTIAKNKTTNSNNNQSSTIDKNTTLPVSGANTIGGKNDKPIAALPAGGVAAASNENVAAAVNNTNKAGSDILPNRSALAAPGPINDKKDAGTTGNLHHTIKDLTVTKTFEKRPLSGSSIDGKTSRETTLAGTKPGDNNYIQSNYSPVAAIHMDGSANTTTEKTRNGRGGYKNNHSPYGKRLIRESNENNIPGGSYSLSLVNQPNAIPAADWFDIVGNLKKTGNIPSSNTALAVGDSIEANRNTATLLNNETKKGIAKAQRDKELEDMSRKEHKLFHLDLSNAFKPFSLHMDAEPRWAAGIALNNGITLGAQNRFNYSMNAKSGVLTDYIPSLYLQFHLNDYVFAQTELNFVSPQYTPQLLVFQQNNDVTPQAGISQQKSVFIQKLYYFSVPVSLHYSPINNLYFSAGLQFSSFQSGLATIQEKQYTTLSGPDHPNSISNTVLKFKDDSIAAKLAPNEWRWQADAEYYFNRFTIGIRYNKSFKTLVNPDAAAAVPNAAGLHNQSMILFLRYNLFESRKKGETQKN
jgi:hypothetical protein